MLNTRFRSHARRGDDRGSMSISWLLGMTFLVVPSLILVLAVPVWQSRAVDASDAARAAVRAMTVGPNWIDDQTAAARAVVQAVEDDGISTDEASASYSYELPSGTTISGDGALPPGSQVKALVTVVVPAGYLPGIGTYASFHYTATFTGTIDSYAADNS